jgi:ATP/ADP translocase/HEAT repeat protein/CRP-like cAMP-binding protein
MPLHRILAPVVELRREEALTAILMFGYSFLAMTVWNTIKPLTRSKFISDLGADNLPYVLLAAGFVIAVLMAGYAWLISRLPRRWGLPITQAGMAGVLIAFWYLFGTNATWVSVAFYLMGMILGVLLISQFWTLANIVYDPRQAKRMFGFIGGGAPLGGVAGSALATNADRIGSINLLLPSAALMIVCATLVAFIAAREKVEADAAAAAKDEKGLGFTEAFDLLRQSKHLQIIGLVISFASIGAAIIEQQLNMAAEASKGVDTDAITAFLGQVGLWMSAIAFFIQVWLTSRIHRYLGIGFALLVLPLSLGSTALVMLFNAALWAPALARILDQSLRYTVDKTTREILFLPLPGDLKLKAKSFVDVTVDRGAKAGGALLLLILVQPWGFNLDWQRLSYASLAMVGLWVVMSIYAKRGYLTAFRDSIERRDLAPAEVRLNAADLSTIETLVQELANPDAERVIYAIDVLESLDKRNLVTPLLLYHESPRVRARALGALAEARTEIARKWAPNIRRLLADPDSVVRARAITALGAISNEDAATLARPMLDDADPRIRATAAVALAGSTRPGDLDVAEATLVNIISDTSEPTRRARRDIAGAIRHTTEPRLQRLLIPLLYDPAADVADEAMESVRAAATGDFVFVPTLIALLRHRRLKGSARAVLVAYGEPVVDALAHFMRDPEEDVWVRRHIPSTLALIPSQKTVDVLTATLEDPDGFLRYKAVSALERLRRAHDTLQFPQPAIESLAIAEGRRYFNYLTLYDNLFGKKRVPRGSLLALALEQKMSRTRDRIFRLLALIYPWRDISAAQWTLDHGDPRARASASEYLDNILTGQLRKRIMPVVEDLPTDEKVRRANVLLKTRPRDAEETLLQLINDEDQVIAASAIDLARQEKMWTLADDIEHVLAYRDAHDWYVFEAASWALAEKRMPAERRRELWLEPLPAAELASRLRELPLFASVSVDELFRIASATRQVRHESGTVLLHEGSVPGTTHFLLDGRVVASSRTGAPRSMQTPSALGFAEALTGGAMTDTVRTDGVAVTLVMTAEELRTLLADNTDLVSGLFATLSDFMEGAASPVHPTGASGELEELALSGLSPVEKVLALQRVPLFSRVSADEMRQLAEITQTVPLTEGTVLFPESAAPALWVILSGEVSLQATATQPVAAIAGPGDFFGAFATMAGRSPGLSASVSKSGIGLRLDREDLFALLAERPELLRQIFAGMFRSESSRLLDTRI